MVPEYQCYSPQAENLLDVFFCKGHWGAWMFLHVKEVWLHVSAWNCVCKYMEKEEKPSTGSTLGE